MNKTLGTKRPWGIVEPIQSNELPRCLDCNIQLTEENDSGWEAFVAPGNTTQPLCKKCELARSLDITCEKAEDLDV